MPRHFHIKLATIYYVAFLILGILLNTSLAPSRNSNTG